MKYVDVFGGKKEVGSVCGEGGFNNRTVYRQRVHEEGRESKVEGRVLCF